MTAPIPTAAPATLRAGDTASWQISLADYPAGDGWSLEYTLINAAGKITFTSAASGNDHRVTVAATTTAGWAAGNYAWQCRAKKGAEVYTVNTGTVDVLPDFATLTASDQRSFAEKTLAALEAWIENHDLAVAEYEIAGRRMKYIPVAELLTLRDKFRREVRTTAGKSGRIYMRF
jgi:hypothetical protein